MNPKKSQEVKAVLDHEQLFPTRLHDLLEFLEKEGLADICSFLPHGRAFLVVDPKRFVDEILPKWFRQNKWTSFQRQLNLYEFKRINAGPDKGAYYSPNFLRGHRELCRFIKRNKVKGSGPRKPSLGETTPDFYKTPLPAFPAAVQLHEAHVTSIPTLMVPSVPFVRPTVAVANEGSGDSTMAFPMITPATSFATSCWAASPSLTHRSFRALLSGGIASLPLSKSNPEDVLFGPSSSRGTSFSLLAELSGAIKSQANMRLVQNLMIPDSLVTDTITGAPAVEVTETQATHLPVGGEVGALNNFGEVGFAARKASGSIPYLPHGRESISTGKYIAASSASPPYNPVYSRIALRSFLMDSNNNNSYYYN